MNIPSQTATQTLKDELARRVALGITHTAFAGVLRNPRHGRRHSDRILG